MRYVIAILFCAMAWGQQPLVCFDPPILTVGGVEYVVSENFKSHIGQLGYRVEYTCSIENTVLSKRTRPSEIYAGRHHYYITLRSQRDTTNFNLPSLRNIRLRFAPSDTISTKQVTPEEYAMYNEGDVYDGYAYYHQWVSVGGPGTYQSIFGPY